MAKKTQTRRRIMLLKILLLVAIFEMLSVINIIVGELLGDSWLSVVSSAVVVLYIPFYIYRAVKLCADL